MASSQHDDESVVIHGDQVIVQRDDLRQCLQVAYWRAGLIEPEAGMRLKEALGIGEAESVPKPGVRP